MKSISIPAFAGLIALALCGCGESQPDYTPFADGLTAIGICMVVAAVVLLSMAGFVLVLVSGFLKVLVVLVIAAAVLWLWRHWPSKK
jgi:hypothetical protein